MWVVKSFSLTVFGRVRVLHRFSVLTPTDDSSDQERLTRLPSHKFWSSEYTARAFQLSVQSQRSRKEEITFLACSLKESSLLVHPAVPRSVGVPVSELLKFSAPPSAVPGCAACWKGPGCSHRPQCPGFPRQHVWVAQTGKERVDSPLAGSELPFQRADLCFAPAKSPSSFCPCPLSGPGPGDVSPLGAP